MESKIIGIKLKDGAFYPILTQGQATTKNLDITTIRDGQETVQIDLFSSETSSMNDANYIITIVVENLAPDVLEKPNLNLLINLDENDNLSASISKTDIFENQNVSVSFISIPEGQRKSDGYKASLDFSSFFKESQINLTEILQNLSTTQDIDSISTDLPSFDIDEPSTPETPESESFEIPEVENQEEITTETPDMPDINTQDYINNNELSDLENDFSMPEAEPSIQDEALPDFSDIEMPTASTEPQDTSDYRLESIIDDKELDDSIPSPSFSFSDLYDEPQVEEETTKKKTKLPVMICICCALISIIVLFLILWFTPTSFLHNSKTEITDIFGSSTEKQENESVTNIDVLKTEPKEELAKENEIVIVENPVVTPEPEKKIPEVKPEPIQENEIIEETKVEPITDTPVASPKEDVIVKVKWGDTLWDLADSYYKNPWLYKRIASYNNLEDPDFIVSGTVLRIPQE